MSFYAFLSFPAENVEPRWFLQQHGGGFVPANTNVNSRFHESEGSVLLQFIKVLVRYEDTGDDRCPVKSSNSWLGMFSDLLDFIAC